MIDSHAHINPQDISDINNMIKFINNLEYLTYCINVGLDYETSKFSIALSNQEEKFYSVIGIHPTREGNLADIYNLYKQSNSSKVVGIGETGLDTCAELEQQKIKFHDSIDLANTLGLPLVIHSNNTNEECLKIIKSHTPQYGFIFHCFQPNLDILKSIMEMGGYISVGTPITRKTAKKSLEVIKQVDINRLLIELDYPYMSNNPTFDGKNVFNRIKEIKGLSYQELENMLDNNTKTLFKKLK